jgi:hypothetical protein
LNTDTVREQEAVISSAYDSGRVHSGFGYRAGEALISPAVQREKIERWA